MDRRRFFPGIVALALALTLAAGAVPRGQPATALAADITCTGEVGREADAPTCRGTGHNDHIIGSPQRDNVVAGNGDDVVEGGDGMDYLQGQKGNDTIDGGPNPDWLIAGPGVDHLTGGDGSDVFLQGEAGDDEADVMDGGNGNDYMDWQDSGGGNDSLNGGGGDDKLYGGEGDDTIDGGDGGDYMEGEQGSDHLIGGDGDDFINAMADETPDSPDTIDCGPGEDEVWANENDTVATNCEPENVRRFDDPTSVASAQQRRATAAEHARARERFWKRATRHSGGR